MQDSKGVKLFNRTFIQQGNSMIKTYQSKTDNVLVIN